MSRLGSPRASRPLNARVRRVCRAGPSSAARCSAVVPDSCVARNAEPIWTPSAPRASAAAMPRASAMPPAATTGARHLGGDDRDERQRADERVLGHPEEGAAMPARLRARRDNHIDARVVERHGFVGRRGRPEGDDPALAQRIEQPGVRDAEHEAERRGTCLQDRLGLLLEARGEALRIRRRLRTHLVVDRPQPRDRVVEAGAGHLGLGEIVVRHPEVERERARRRLAKLAGDGGDRRRIEVVHAERSQAARAGDGGDELDARQAAAERA